MNGKGYQITIADENGVVIDTGWVFLPGSKGLNPYNGQPLAGEALYDTVLQFGLDNGIYNSPEESKENQE